MQEDTHVCVSESLINYNPDRKNKWEGDIYPHPVQLGLDMRGLHEGGQISKKRLEETS